jgi:hypothetical protein
MSHPNADRAAQVTGRRTSATTEDDGRPSRSPALTAWRMCRKHSAIPGLPLRICPAAVRGHTIFSHEAWRPLRGKKEKL